MMLCLLLSFGIITDLTPCFAVDLERREGHLIVVGLVILYS